MRNPWWLPAVGLAALLGLLGPGLLSAQAAPDAPAEVRGYYLGGGTTGTGVATWCDPPVPMGGLPPEWQVDIGGACDLTCPGGTCSIEVWDDLNGADVHFRVCVPGEEFCRPFLYYHTAFLVAPIVTVAPTYLSGTHGVVIVR